MLVAVHGVQRRTRRILRSFSPESSLTISASCQRKTSSLLYSKTLFLATTLDRPDRLMRIVISEHPVHSSSQENIITVSQLVLRFHNGVAVPQH
jgi:hypothetical protein